MSIYGVENIMDCFGGIDRLVQNKPMYVLTLHSADGARKVTGAIRFLTLSTEG
jgi:hypothetical protein